MGTEAKQQLCLRGLQNAAGFLQQCVSDRIDTRYTPRLQFVLDQGVKTSIAVAEKLRGYGMNPRANTPEIFAEDIRREAEQWGRIIREQKIKAE